MIRWSIFRCPLLGSLKEQIAEDISHKPEPWLSHAISCLHKQTISPNATMIIIGLSEKDGTIGFVWLSLPDSELLAGWKSYSYLFHVFIKEDFRGMGYGKIGTKIACDFSKSLGVNGVLLATDNEGLRTKFYPSFGFRPLSSDPWLMKKIYRIPENKKSRSIALLRSVSHHDLSTIQSICGQPHWQHQMFTPARKKEEEVEEEFCDLYVTNAEQYLRECFLSLIALLFCTRNSRKREAFYGFFRELQSTLCCPCPKKELRNSLLSKVRSMTFPLFLGFIEKTKKNKISASCFQDQIEK